MRKHTPRRCTSRWLDGDCPKGVLCIIGGEAVSVVYSQVHEHAGKRCVFGREMSDNPFHPQGVGCSFEIELHQLSTWRRGSRYARWSSLTEQQRKCVLADLKDNQ